MKRRDLADLLLLAAVWGASFLFMKLGAADFGPVPLVFLRVAGASLLLVPLLARQGQLAQLAQHWRALGVVGLANSALPFLLYMVAALVLGTGLMAIFNATAPLWGALIAWAWLGDRPTRQRALGLALGFGGVLALGWQHASLEAGEHGVSPALGIVCCLAATLCYGFAANYTKKRLGGVPSLVSAAGSQLGASLLLLVPAIATWPAAWPSALSWAAAAALAFVCTGFAYLLYFRLIARIGPANAISVTFLIPVFGGFWGTLFLGERITTDLLAGCAVILVGTALAAGVVGGRR